MAKGLEQLTKDGYQPYAAEAAHNRELRSTLTAAR
jgi:hypothetical protein